MVTNLTGTHVHRPTGLTLLFEWGFDDHGSAARWTARALHGRRQLDQLMGQVRFDPCHNDARSAAEADIKRELDRRQHRYQID